MTDYQTKAEDINDNFSGFVSVFWLEEIGNRKEKESYRQFVSKLRCFIHFWAL
jgi:hypothetical protein